MSKKILPLLFLLCPFIYSAQLIRFHGNVKDTAAGQGLPNALLMALRFKDSSLVAFSRSDAKGNFKAFKTPADTFIVIITHPNFSDKTYLLLPSEKDTAFHFKNVLLPPKSVTLKEVEVLAYKEKMYYKGDTLVFTADSFKTRPNATVEDLLKKLPGVQVDANGKITIQGKQVDQVLVDGDEFFGSDPTIATRNLNASSIENIQVYDKKNENAEEGKDENLKVVNLKLKEDAKKGYFGKISGATDFSDFYENELLFNRFKNNQKLSVFGLLANTPKQAFGWEDSYKYGLTGEIGMNYDEDNDMRYFYGQQNETGVPQTIKTGYYFADKFGKNTKLNNDYTLNQSRLNVKKITNTQFFLQDTSYTNATNSSSSSFNQNHSFNVKVEQKLDSLTELRITSKLKYINSDYQNTQTDDFISQAGDTTRRTVVNSRNLNENSDLNVQLKLLRNFKKKDRKLTINYQPVYNSSASNYSLQTNFYYFNNQQKDSILQQRRRQNNFKMEHNASAVFVEPLNKKFKTEVNYTFAHSLGNNSRSTFDYSSGSDIFNGDLSNSFENRRMVNRAGAKLIYDVKKYRISVGSNFRTVEQENENLSTKEKLNLRVNNVLPLASFVYRIGQSSQWQINYTSASDQPQLLQMQPLRDNSNPNNIVIGNPNLEPTFSNRVDMHYYFYKGISDRNFYLGANYNNTARQISTATSFDSEGRTVSQSVNLSGNYNGGFYMGGGFPVFKRFMKIHYYVNGRHYNEVSLINSVKNSSQSTSIRPSLSFNKDEDKYEISIGGHYEYSVPKTNISSLASQPFYTYGMEGNIMVKLPKKFMITADGNYTNNGNRSPGYNINYFILNASVSKAFTKSGNLIVSAEAYDLLNQNIDNNRFISDNQIVDTRTTVIKRYFLFKVLLKLNSQKEKEDEDDD